MLFRGYSSAKTLVIRPMSGIYAIVPNHFEMFFRYVLRQPFHELQYRYVFNDVFVVTMSVVVERDGITIVRVDAFSSYYRTAKVSADILCNSIRVTLIGFGVDIKTVFVNRVNESFCTFEGFANARFQFIK